VHNNICSCWLQMVLDPMQVVWLRTQYIDARMSHLLCLPSNSMYDHLPIPLGSCPVVITLEAWGPAISGTVPPGWYMLSDGSVLLDVLILA